VDPFHFLSFFFCKCCKVVFVPLYVLPSLLSAVLFFRIIFSGPTLKSDHSSSFQVSKVFFSSYPPNLLGIVLEPPAPPLFLPVISPTDFQPGPYIRRGTASPYRSDFCFLVFCGVCCLFVVCPNFIAQDPIRLSLILKILFFLLL